VAVGTTVRRDSSAFICVSDVSWKPDTFGFSSAVWPQTVFRLPSHVRSVDLPMGHGEHGVHTPASNYSAPDLHGLQIVLEVPRQAETISSPAPQSVHCTHEPCTEE